jgi:isopentenyl diphosphate isomerase/L-lactate dehydrogenase-like FMN-dependent dehydrogenase
MASDLECKFLQMVPHKVLYAYTYRMRPVGTIDMKSSMLGITTAMPIFVSPAALAGLGHSEGELNITRAAGKAGIIQGVSHFAPLAGFRLTTM